MRLEDTKGKLRLCLLSLFCECTYECGGYWITTNKHQFFSLSLSVHVCVRMFVFMCVWMYICMWVCMCVCVYVCGYVCVWVCMYVNKPVSVWECECECEWERHTLSVCVCVCVCVRVRVSEWERVWWLVSGQYSCSPRVAQWAQRANSDSFTQTWLTELISEPTLQA